MVRADRVIGSIVAIRVGSEAKEVFLRIVAVARPGFKVQVVVGNPWKRETRFRRPIPLDAPGRPDLERPGVGEEIAIAKAHAVGEPAAGGQRAELGMEALAVEDEDRLVLGEVEGLLQAVRLVGLDLFGLLFAALPVGLFACRLLRPGDARREDRQREAQHCYSEHGRESTSIDSQPDSHGYSSTEGGFFATGLQVDDETEPLRLEGGGFLDPWSEIWEQNDGLGAARVDTR